MASKADWARHIEDWRGSGTSRDEYAAVHGLESKTLQWWVSKLARDAGKRSKRSRVRFAQVVEGAPPLKPPSPLERRVASVPPASALEVVIARGRTVRVSSGFDRALLRAVVEALEAP